MVVFSGAFRRTPVVFCFLLTSKVNEKDNAQEKANDQLLANGHTIADSSKWDKNWDRRQPEHLLPPSKRSASDLDRVKSRACRNLFFIRHGQYNLQSKEKQLTELGKRQAELCGKRLMSLKHPFTNFVTSTKIRAIETSTIVAQVLNRDQVVQDALLDEGSPVQPEPSTKWQEELRYYQDGPRIEAAFRRHVHRAPPEQTEDTYELFICHANVIRYIVCRALQLPPEAWLRISLAHCSITWLQITPSGRVILRQLGGHSYLPADMITTS